MSSPLTRPPRTRSIRTKVIRLLFVPLLSLTLVWGYAAAIVGNDALKQRQWSEGTETLVDALGAVQGELHKERAATVVYLSTPRSTRAQFDALRPKTDAAAQRFRSLLVEYERPYGLTVDFDRRRDDLIRQLDSLPRIRAAIDERQVSRLKALESFTPIIEAFSALSDVWIAFDDRELVRLTLSVTVGARGLELLSREAALVSGAFLSRGRLTAEEHRAFVQMVAEQRRIWETQRAITPQRDYADHVQGQFAVPAFAKFRQMEDQIISNQDGRIPVPSAEWTATAPALLDQMNKYSLDYGDVIGDRGRRYSAQQVVQVGLVGGLGLLALTVSVLISARFGRRMVRELVGLRNSARRLAEERLPDVVSRLSRGHQVEAAVETPAHARKPTTEIAEVAGAFGAVQRTAVQAAVGQAELREGTRAIFLNIARRNQSLLHRQLSMLDALESRAEPDDLEDLFALDHLTTRMRRHAESLIILSGGTPGRGWRRPVRIIDVVRAAVAEVEQYTRISVVRTSEDGLVGAVVTDVIHLLAELLENATAFSPPNTEVGITADRVGTGYAIEIEDRGLGMPQPEMDRINQRLAAPPEFDLADTDQLGLFVVARLAVRHGIQVSLRRSPFGGTTAIVLVPSGLVVDEIEMGPADGGMHRADEFGAPEPGRHRLDGPASADPMVPAGQDRPQAITSPERGAHGRVTPLTERTGAGRASGAYGDGGQFLDNVGPGPVPPPPPPAQSSWAAGGPMPVPEEGTHAGLPRRVRQKNLAPQLREESQDTTVTGPLPSPTPQEARSPEEARSLASSLQTGWQRGRSAPAPTSGTVFDTSNTSRPDGPGNPEHLP